MGLLRNRILFVLGLFWSCRSGDCNCESEVMHSGDDCFIKAICYSQNVYETSFDGCYYKNKEHSVTFVDICNENPLNTVIQLNHQNVRHIFVINSLCTAIPHVNGAEKVEDYNLHGNKLETIIVTLNNFPSLKVLDISNNVISDIRFNYLSNVHNLIKLNVSFNNIETINAWTFKSLNSLEILDLSSNKLEKLEILSFSGLENLKVLILSNNKLTQINNAFYSLKQLQEIDLNLNQLTGINKEDLKNLENLKNLILSNNKISEVNYDFSSLTYIEEIKLDFNQITEIKKEYFENLENLKVLLLNSNYITKVEWSFTKLLPLLVKFDISNNSIRILDKKVFTNNTGLEYVDLSNNRLERLNPNTFLNKNLTFFSIKDNLLQGRLEKGMFEGMKAIRKLDLSYQKVDTVMDYAFHGLINLVELLLNDNDIHALQNKAFSSLFSLEILDLSKNMLHNIDYEKTDLNKLKYLYLQYNSIDSLGATSFLDTGSLNLLDLSYNNITHLEKQVFGFLHEVVHLELCNNFISGALEAGTFEGLESVPSLDLSYTSINQIKNKSFDGLLQLKKLNISRSHVNELEFDAFCDLSELESMDLSYNKLTVLKVNFSCIENVKFLFLNENYLATLGPVLLSNLMELDLSFNKLTNLEDNSLKNLKALSILNLSYNNFTFTFSLVKHIKKLSSLSLSGLYLEATNTKYENLDSVKSLDLSDSNIVNISISVRLDYFVNCDDLNLSKNKIPFVKYGMIPKNTKIKIINLSRNEISFLQPGCFKDNNEIEVLNLAHNKLFELEYGTFKGMWRLSHLDISFNSIRTLNGGIFDETLSLRTLIADDNKIKTIDDKYFSEFPLQTLSIGGNPIPCFIIRHFYKSNQRLFLTALEAEHHKSNYGNISCFSGSDKILSNGNSAEVVFNNHTFERQEQLLEDIKDLIKTVVAKDNNKNNTNHSEYSNAWYKLVDNIQSGFNKTEDMNVKLLSKFDDDTKTFTESLNKIIRFVNFTLERLQFSQSGLSTENKTSGSMLNYLLQDLNDKIDDFDKRMSKIEQNQKHSADNKTDILRKESNNMHESSPLINEQPAKSEDRASVFQNICLGFIAIVILCLVLHKIYKSDLFVPVRRSLSRRQINESMETATFST